MTHTILSAPAASPRLDIDTLIARHGRWRVLGAVAGAFLHRASRHETVGHRLNAHLSRDIGLPPRPEPPPSMPHRVGPHA